MLKFQHYFYRDEDEAPKFILSLDWYSFEDSWTQRFIFDRPCWNDEAMMERARLRNLARCKWFRVSFNIMHHHFHIDFKTKLVGNVYNGRQMDDGPKPIPSRKKRELK